MAGKRVKRVAPDIPIGSKWTRKEDHGGLVAKVLAYTEGYVMFRFPRCVPSVIRWDDWVNDFEPVQTHFQKWSKVIKQINLS